MIADTVDRKRHLEAYGIQCQPLARNRQTSKASVNVIHCLLAVGDSTELHQHRESETFFVLSGEGQIRSAGKKIQIKAGSTVVVPAFQDHVLSNTSLDQDFVFLSIYSDAAAIPIKNQQQVVIAAPPTPNGDLHLGHLGGPYLASDIYQRYLRLQNKQVLSISGTDDFQNYVEAYAKKTENSSSEVAEIFRAEIQKTFSASNIQFDELFQPSQDKSYQFFVAEFFKVLLNKGLFKIKQVETYFEKQSGQVVRESLIQGDCPHCNNKVIGNGCEECGYVGDVNTLKNATHTEALEIELRPVQRAVLNLKPYEMQVRQFLAQSEFQHKLQALADLIFSNKAEFPATYPGTWGVPAPILEQNNQVINVWIEMAASYVYASRKHNVSFLDFKKASTSLFCGIDNAFYYAILIPTILLAYDSSLSRPYELQLNEFWNLDGKKFSTSRRHAIWAQDFLKKEKADDLRFYFALKRPLYGKENFTMDNYKQTLEIIQSTSIDKMTESLRQILFDQHELGALSSSDKVSDDVIVELQEIVNQYEKNFVRASSGLKQNAHLLSYLIIKANDLHLRFQTDLSQKANFIYTMRILATLLAPYMPNRSALILSYFTFSEKYIWIDDLSHSTAKEEMQKFYEPELRRAE